MKCAKCGAELKKGCLYCSVCGHEAQIVSDYNVLEDDYLRSLLKDGEGEKIRRRRDRRPKKQKRRKKLIWPVLYAAVFSLPVRVLALL